MAILDDVKSALNVVGNYADDVLNIHIGTVQNYLTNAGVAASVVNSDKVKGAVVRGVADLWSVDAGDVTFSPAFMNMVVQLAVCYPETNAETEPSADQTTEPETDEGGSE